MRGKGAPRADGTSGDLLATVEVQVPAVLDEAAREAVEAYREATAGKPLRAGLFEDADVVSFTQPPGPDAAVYVISVAAQLTGLHPQTLRTYERIGLITPGPHRRRRPPLLPPRPRAAARRSPTSPSPASASRACAASSSSSTRSPRCAPATRSCVAELEATREALRAGAGPRRPAPPTGCRCSAQPDPGQALVVWRRAAELARRYGPPGPGAIGGPTGPGT